ncbi:hypothetical protein ACNS7O_18100 (plasmid) [Haloferacaceae archaeon DSL9]
MDRRQFLRCAGAGAFATALAGCSANRPSEYVPTGDGDSFFGEDEPSEPSEPTAESIELPEPERTIDVVEAGADPTGTESIVPVLEEIATDGALLRFPSGRYLVDRTFVFRNFTNFGMVGENANILPRDGNDAYLFRFGSTDRPAALRFGGFHFDFSAPRTGGRAIQARISDRLLVQNVSAGGGNDIGPNVSRFDITGEDGVGVVDRLVFHDGAASNTTISGCYVGTGHRGELTFQNCQLVGFPDNGLYADPPRGTVNVLGGYYANNGISNVRIRNGSIVRGVHVRCDDARTGFDNMRGIRLTGGENPSDERVAIVEDSLVEMLAVTESDGGIVIESDIDGVTIANVRIRTEADNVAGVRIKSPEDAPTDSSRIECRGVTIGGGASDRAAVRVTGRPKCVLDGLCIYQTGPNRDGIEFSRSAGTISNARIRVTGESVIADRSTLERDNVQAGSVNQSEEWLPDGAPPWCK